MREEILTTSLLCGKIWQITKERGSTMLTKQDITVLSELAGSGVEAGTGGFKSTA